MELQYLRYPGKGAGYYGRHVDQQPGGRESELGLQTRAISLLAYLNPDWDCARDGGQLRAYYPAGDSVPGDSAAVVPTNTNEGRRKKSGGGGGSGIVRATEEVEDVEPLGGTLVLFDSKSVEHEACPTNKERWALVGWFLDVPVSKNNSAAGELPRGKKKKNKRS
jgi:Rps23 Pro-64 3,4-dihydroxylase Tpa1-like proline 4-hydroxylase